MQLPPIRNWLLLGGLLAAASLVSAEEPRFVVGACTHFGQGKAIPANLDYMKQAGILAARDEVSWGSCEREKGKLAMPESYDQFVNLLGERSLRLINILDYANKFYDEGGYPTSPEAVEGFARYCEFVVGHFKGRIKYYQVWNEWDGGCGMGDKYKGKGTPEDYGKLLKVVYPRIKAVDPDCVVLTNSVCRGDKWLDQMLAQDILGSCDGVALHTYNYSQSGDQRTPEAWHTRLLGVGEMLLKHSGGKPVDLYITEMGWPTHLAGSGTPPEESATFLARLYLLARTLPFLKGIWWYDFQDDGWKPDDNENNFGMVRADLTPKPAYFVMSDISGLVANAEFVKREDVGDPEIWILRYKLPDGREALAAWSAHADHGWQLTLKNAAANPAPVSIRRAGNKAVERVWGDRQWVEKKPLAADEIRLTIHDRPWLIEGDLSQVTVTGVVKREFAEAKRPQHGVMVVPNAVAAAAPAGATAQTVDFSREKDYRNIITGRYTGPADIAGNFTANWDKDNLYLTISITDDTFSQTYGVDETWRGDGVQVAFQALGEDNEEIMAHTELDLALTAAGPKVYREAAPDKTTMAGETADFPLEIQQNGQTTVYKLTVPVAKAGLPRLKPGKLLGLSILVNDNDGQDREGYLHWGEGIGHGKNPLEYNWLMMAAN